MRPLGMFAAPRMSSSLTVPYDQSQRASFARDKSDLLTDLAAYNECVKTLKDHGDYTFKRFTEEASHASFRFKTL
jgi:hypothetical protein